MPWVARPRAGDPDRVAKVPVRRRGRGLYPTGPDEPAAWMSFGAALAEVAGGHADGVGMCLPEQLCVIDIDHVLHDGILNAEARQLVTRSRTWTEISPSSTGVHLWFAADAPLRSGRSGGLELLTTGRFVTVTGRQLGTVRTVAALPDDLSALFGPAEHRSPGPVPIADREAGPGGDPDAAFSAALHHSESLRRLYLLGDTSAFRSRSEADLSCLQQIHRWVGPDLARIDALFRQSALFREERWSNAAYRERTLALVLCSGRWRPEREGSVR